MARWASRPERVLRRAGFAVAMLALGEFALVVVVPGRGRLIMAGALVGACLSLAVIVFDIVRVRHVVGAVGDPHRDAADSAPSLPAALLDGFPMDELRPALLADPVRLNLDLLYGAWTCALLGRDAAWIQARYGLPAWVCDLLAREARAVAGS